MRQRDRQAWGGSSSRFGGDGAVGSPGLGVVREGEREREAVWRGWDGTDGGAGQTVVSREPFYIPTWWWCWGRPASVSEVSQLVLFVCLVRAISLLPFVRDCEIRYWNGACKNLAPKYSCLHHQLVSIILEYVWEDLVPPNLCNGSNRQLMMWPN